MADHPVHVSNAPEKEAEDEVNTVTHCADCKHPIQPLKSPREGGRFSRKKICDLDYCNLQAGKTTGTCGCVDPRRSLRLYVVKRKINSDEKRCWLVKDQQLSTNAKVKRNDILNAINPDPEMYTTDDYGSLILNDPNFSNQAMNNAQNQSWLEYVTKVADSVSSAGKIVLIKFTDYTTLTARAEYTCPKCKQQKWSWQVAKGVPCLKCMGFEKVRDSWHEEAAEISDAEEPDAKSVLKLFYNFLGEIKLMRLISLVISYAPYFLMFSRYHCDESHDQVNSANRNDNPTYPLLDPNHEENAGAHHDEPIRCYNDIDTQERYFVNDDIEIHDASDDFLQNYYYFL